jgi:hypothetical protein
MSGCCEKHNGSWGGCLGASLPGDSNMTCTYIQTRRGMVANKETDEKFVFMQELFRSSISKVILDDNGDVVRYQMDYPHDMCKQCVAVCHDVTPNYIDNMSKKMKSTQHGRIYSEKIRSYKDSTLLDFNYAETESVFREHLPSDAIGMLLLLSLLLLLSRRCSCCCFYYCCWHSCC